MGDTVAVVEQLRKRCPDLPLRLVQEPTEGTGPARNAALDAARYELLAFTDDDCVVGQDWVARTVATGAQTSPHCTGAEPGNFRIV